GIGGYNLTSRAYSSQNTRGDLQLTETAIIHTSIVMETRFAWTRQTNDQFGTTSPFALSVAGSFVDGSAQTGLQSNRNNQFEWQSNFVQTHGVHTLRFGMRAREFRITDSNLSNKGGTFTFFGVSGAPVLGADNQPLNGADGKPLTADISSLEQYRRTLLFKSL